MHDFANGRWPVAEEAADSAISFLAELTGELSVIARRHRFDTLVYILDMAKLEAENIRRNLSARDD